MNTILLYTDGGCSGNPGPGGWAYTVVSEERELIKTGSGADAQTTNNKMELTAVIEALKTLLEQNTYEGVPVHLYTDSQYVKNGITKWIFSWLRNGWKTSAKKPVKNRELWIELKRVSDALPVTWHWVKGHAGDEFNEMCDSLVQEQIAVAHGMATS